MDSKTKPFSIQYKYPHYLLFYGYINNNSRTHTLYMRTYVDKAKKNITQGIIFFSSYLKFFGKYVQSFLSTDIFMCFRTHTQTYVMYIIYVLLNLAKILKTKPIEKKRFTLIPTLPTTRPRKPTYTQKCHNFSVHQPASQQPPPTGLAGRP